MRTPILEIVWKFVNTGENFVQLLRGCMRSGCSKKDIKHNISPNINGSALGNDVLDYAVAATKVTWNAVKNFGLEQRAEVMIAGRRRRRNRKIKTRIAFKIYYYRP